MKLETRVRLWTLGFAMFGISVTAIPFAAGKAGVVMNQSDSVKGTFFLRSKDPSAPYVVFCAPSYAEVAPALAGMKHGECPGGYPPLLKPWIEASPAHPVILTKWGVLVDGRILPKTKPLDRATWGASLTHYEFGVYINGLWPISTENAHSYDARYFGPIKPEQVLYHAKKLI